METPLQQATRLLGALEEMVELEGMYLRGGYYDLTVETRNRAEPLVAQLVRLARQPGVGALQPRVGTLLARSSEHTAFLQTKMTELQSEMRQTEQAHRQTARLRPAYARSTAFAMPRFQAAG